MVFSPSFSPDGDKLAFQLIGPGHSAGSIMTAVWDGKTLAAARQSWLTFSQSQRASIHHETQARTPVTGSR
jgi:hypothetical protein